MFYLTDNSCSLYDDTMMQASLQITYIHPHLKFYIIRVCKVMFGLLHIGSDQKIALLDF